MVQATWAREPVSHRLAVLRRLRERIAADPEQWAASIETPQQRTTAESLAAEVGPLADACRWLERRAKKVLKARREGGMFSSVKLCVERAPLGVVLVIGASNYPLFLLAIPALQALAAGNAVLLKPSPGGAGSAELLRSELLASGLDPALCVLLDDSAEAAQRAIQSGVDHVVLTGSAETGVVVAQAAAETLTPCTLECSGADPVVVLPGADLERVAKCVAWGLTFNSGATCIAPRRVIAGAEQLAEIEAILVTLLADAAPRTVSQRSADETERLVGAAIKQGARVASPVGTIQDGLRRSAESQAMRPIVLAVGEIRPDLLKSDLFAPVTTLLSAESIDQSINLANDCPYALGASVFGPEMAAQQVARRLTAGCVTINDLIAPTADPRLPFGGSRRSGYGVTRGGEGLLAMTRPRSVTSRRGRWLPHLDPPSESLTDLIAGMIQSRHATGLAARWRGVRRFLSAANDHKKNSQEQSG